MIMVMVMVVDAVNAMVSLLQKMFCLGDFKCDIFAKANLLLE